MSKPDIRPLAMMDQLNQEEEVANRLSRTVRRVKIDQNWTWNIRLLPVAMGPEKTVYVRVVQHWRNRAPIVCPSFMPSAWGGNPEFKCPICEVSDRLRDSGDKEVNDIGYEARPIAQYRFWCLVFDMQDPRGRIDEMDLKEVLNPYEFAMSKTTFDDFKKFQRMAATRSNKASQYYCLDLETGCNFLAQNGGRGIRLDRQDPAHALEGFCDLSSPDWDKHIETAFSRIQKPVITIPKDRALNEWALKIEDDAQNPRKRGRSEERGSGRGRDRFNDHNDRNDERESDYRRGSSGRDRFNPRDEDRVDQEPDDREVRRRGGSAIDEAEDNVPMDEQPAESPRRSRTREVQEPTEPARQQKSRGETPPSRRQQVTSTAATPEPVETLSDEELTQDQAPNEAVDAAPEAATEAQTPPTRRSAPAAPPSARKQQAAPAAQAQDVPTTTTQGKRNGHPETGVDEELDNVPDEARDPAPATGERTEEAPPKVSATAPPPRRSTAPAAPAAASSATGNALRSRLTALSNRGQ